MTKKPAKPRSAVAAGAHLRSDAGKHLDRRTTISDQMDR